MESSQEAAVRPQQQNPEKKDKFQDLKNKVISVFRREKPVTKENLPPMKIDFYLSRHAYASDADLGGKELDSYDILIPEAYGWTPNTLTDLREVSAGNMSINNSEKRETSTFRSHYRATKSRLKGSNIAVGLMDMPQGYDKDFMKANDEELRKAIEVRHQAIIDGDFASANASTRRLEEVLTKDSARRDEYILTHFPQTIQEVLDAYPELKNKPSLQILVRIGTMHTTLVNDFKRAGYEVSRDYVESPAYFESRDEIFLKLSMGKEVPDLLVARSLMEYVLSNDSRIKRLDKENQNQTVKFLRGVSAQFTTEEIKSFIEGFKGVSHNRHKLDEYVALFLKAKGIRLPKTKEELIASLEDFKQRQQKSQPVAAS